MKTVRLAEAFEQIHEHWHPHIVARVNDTDVKVARVLGTFDWHHHKDQDELFWVQRGRLRIELRNGTVELGPGEMAVVPRGVEHRPVAEEEVELVLIEPTGTVNTGEERTERTVDADWL